MMMLIHFEVWLTNTRVFRLFKAMTILFSLLNTIYFLRNIFDVYKSFSAYQQDSLN